MPRSAFSRWTNDIKRGEISKLIQKHRLEQERLVKESLDNYQIQFLDGRIICYKLKRTVVIQ